MFIKETSYKRIMVLMDDNFPVVKNEQENTSALFKLHDYEIIGTPEECKKAIKFYDNFNKFITELGY